MCGSRSRKPYSCLQKRSSGAEAAQPEGPRPTNRAGTMDPMAAPARQLNNPAVASVYEYERKQKLAGAGRGHVSLTVAQPWGMLLCRYYAKFLSNYAMSYQVHSRGDLSCDDLQKDTIPGRGRMRRRRGRRGEEGKKGDKTNDVCVVSNLGRRPDATHSLPSLP